MSADSQDIIREWYRGPYAEITASANGSVFDRYMRSRLEHPLRGWPNLRDVLEIGAHNGEQVKHVHHGFDRYVLTDLAEPLLPPELSADPRFAALACDASALPFAAASFDRVLMTCVLHHVSSPLAAAAEMRRVCRPGGVISILVPTDPGLAYRWGKAATSGLAARRRGLSDQFELVNAISHGNHFRSIRVQLLHVFAGDRVHIDWLPTRVPSMNLNAFTVWTIVVR